MELFDYTEVFYNQRRRASTLKQIGPAAFERQPPEEGMDAMENRRDRGFPTAPAPVLVQAQKAEDQRRLRSQIVHRIGSGPSQHAGKGGASPSSLAGEVRACVVVLHFPAEQPGLRVIKQLPPMFDAHELSALVGRLTTSTVATLEDDIARALLVAGVERKAGMRVVHVSMSWADGVLRDEHCHPVLRRLGRGLSPLLWMPIAGVALSTVRHFVVPQSILLDDDRPLLQGFTAEQREWIASDVRALLDRLTELPEDAKKTLSDHAGRLIRPFRVAQFAYVFPLHTARLASLAFAMGACGLTASAQSTLHPSLGAVALAILAFLGFLLSKKLYVLRHVGALYKMNGSWQRGSILIRPSTKRADVAKYVSHEMSHYLRDHGYIRDDVVASAVGMLRMMEVGNLSVEDILRNNSAAREGYESMKRVLSGEASPKDLDASLDAAAKPSDGESDVLRQWLDRKMPS